MKQFDEFLEFLDTQSKSGVTEVHGDDYYKTTSLDSVNRRNSSYCDYLASYVSNYASRIKHIFGPWVLT